MNHLALATAALLVAHAAGCASGAQRRANARLRDDNATLHAQVEALTLQVSALQSRAATHERPSIDPAALPQLGAIAISPSSGLDPTPAGDTPVLQLLVTALDSRARPIQLAGTLDVQVYVPRADEAPLLVGSVHLDHDALAEAWRGGPMGVRWLAQVPLPEGTTADGLLVHVQHADARSGRTFNDALTFPSRGN